MDLEGADLRWTHLWSANLKGAHLKGANLKHADFEEADLSDADLSDTYLGHTLFRNTNLRNSIFSHAIMYATVFMDVDLSQVKGLETGKHLGSSSLFLDTLVKSHGQIPEVFLRGAGGPSSVYACLIEYNHLLTDASTDYPPCFLVYSHEDEELARHLSRDLYTHGIRCWFDAGDVLPGLFLFEGIVSPVRFYDTVVLILSDEPEYKEWADNDIRAALEQEELEGLQVLFPLFRDAKVLTSDHPWTAYLRETRELGDFRQWQNEAEYQQAFSQLLYDLKARK